MDTEPLRFPLPVPPWAVVLPAAAATLWTLVYALRARRRSRSASPVRAEPSPQSDRGNRP